MRIAGVAPFVYVSFLAFSVVHCGSERGSSASASDGGSDGGSSNPSNLNAFLGTWSCQAQSTIKVTTPVGTPTRRPIIAYKNPFIL